MQSLYEILKASKGLPVSDMYAALWGKSVAESSIKTITGRLPLYFRTNEATEFKLRDWVIYGNNDVGKNLLEITAESQTINDVIVTVDKNAGTVTSAGTPTAERYFYPQGSQKRDISDAFFSNGNIITCGGVVNGVSFGINYYTSNGTFLSQQFINSNTSTLTVDIPHNAGQYRMIFVFTTGGSRNTTMYPMIRKAGTSSTFEPYQVGVGEKTENGYVVNIGVGFAPIPSNPEGALYYRKTINIGESPLTEGQTLSLSQFGDIGILPFNDMYIAAFEGFAGGDQLSYNQPEMMIKYKE